MKPCTSVQETSEEVLFIKSWQIHIHRGLMLMLDSSLTEAISIENYEIRIFKYDFTHIHEYLCTVSFLITLDIYKDYFKSCHRWCNLMQSDYTCILWLEIIFPRSSYSLLKLLCLCAKDFVTKELLDLHCWMNWRTLQPTSSSSLCVSHVLESLHHWLVMYWEPCIERKDCHYITSLIGYWGKGSTVG